MGLDMYLSKRKYVKNWSHEDKKDRYSVIVKKGGVVQKVDLPITEVVYEAAYWRKANAIHNWFVNNVQDGEDDCKEYWVSREKLQELVDLCKIVLETAQTTKGKVHNGTRYTKNGSEEIFEDGLVVTNADEIRELLPPTSGFFFGSTDIDQYFLEDCKETVIQLTHALAQDDSGNFYYQSSW